MSDDAILFFPGKLTGFVAGPQRTIIVNMDEQNPDKPGLGLALTFEGVAHMIAALTTAAAHAAKHHGRLDAPSVLPLRSMTIERSGQRGIVAFDLVLEGELRIPLALPATLAQQLARSLQEEATKALGPEEG